MIVILCIVILVLYLFYKKTKNQKSTEISENFGMLKKHKKRRHKKILPDCFIEAQFHNDYRDTLTAFNNIAPSQRQTFNLAHLPVAMSNLKPNGNETNGIIKDFISELNENIIGVVPDYRVINSGWDEQLIEPEFKSGWEAHMEKLGLPKSLYPDPAKKALVELIKVDHIEK